MWLDLLFRFTGRINRAKYWLATLVQVAFLYVVTMVVGVVVGVIEGVTRVPEGWIVIPLVMAVAIAGLSQLAVLMKRAHDCDRGVLFVVLYFVPIVAIWPTIVLWFLRGSIGPNRYGPDPLARRDIETYSAEIARNPKNALALVARGSTRALIGEYDHAIADLDAAIALDPQDPEAFNSGAFVHFRLGRLASAIADYDRAIALSARNAEALFGRGVVRLRMADQDGTRDIAAAKAIDQNIAARMALLSITA